MIGLVVCHRGNLADIDIWLTRSTTFGGHRLGQVHLSAHCLGKVCTSCGCPCYFVWFPFLDLGSSGCLPSPALVGWCCWCSFGSGLVIQPISFRKAIEAPRLVAPGVALACSIPQSHSSNYFTLIIAPFNYWPRPSTEASASDRPAAPPNSLACPPPPAIQVGSIGKATEAVLPWNRPTRYYWW